MQRVESLVFADVVENLQLRQTVPLPGTPVGATEGGIAMKCCHGCVAPKRHTACWGHCPEYIEERAEYDKKKAAEDKKKAVNLSIYYQKCDGVRRATKKHGSKRKK